MGNIAIDVAKKNIDIIFNNPDAKFVTDNKENLDSISKWNVVGILVEWIRDKFSRGERSQKTHVIILKVLSRIQEDLEGKNKDSCFFYKTKGPAFNTYLYRGTMHEFAEKVKNSDLDNDIAVHARLEKIQELSQDFFTKNLTQQQKNEALTTPYNFT